ncbi:MAG: hypothetical protein ACFNM7_04190 [Prevotella conceptionensis]
MALQKEIWVNQIKENFYPDSSFLNFVRDFSAMVEFDAINIAEAGVDPEVLINSNTYPIRIKQRVDNNQRIELDKFETENTLVRRPEVIEYSYDQLESVLMGHRNTLRASTARKAAHAFAPIENGAYTPVISTTGEKTRDGRKRLTVADILALKEEYDMMDVPLEMRYLVLNPRHVSDLILFDTKAFKDIVDLVDGKPRRFAGFNMLQTSVTPTYNAVDLKKVAFGAEKASTDTFCSFSYCSDEVMKADGEIYLYSRYDDPEQRGTIVGFDKRFVAMPIRNRGIGAIVSAKD